MTELAPCPFCGSKPETPFENLRDSEDMEGMVTVWTIHHHCRGIDMWIEGSDAEECAENWNRRSSQPQYLSNCLRAGACHGVCESTACTNYGKVIVVRRCVEPKQDGVIYLGVET